MGGIGPGDLHDLAQEFLDACVEALDTIPTYESGLGGAPARYFVAPGQPAFDCCPQLTVHVGQITPKPSFLDPRQADERINYVQLIAYAIRCVPVPEGNSMPSPEDQALAAEQIDADKWALWNHIFNLVRVEQLFGKCCDVIWNGLQPIVPQGGCGGSILTVTVCFDGYQETIGS